MREIAGAAAKMSRRTETRTVFALRKKNKIMPNEIVRTIPEMLTFSGLAAAAALKHGPANEVDQNTAARIYAERTALLNSRDAYEQSRTTLAQRRALLIALVQTV